MSQTETAQRPLRIVIADDEPIIRLDLRKTLEKLGYEVVGEAGDGGTALEAVRELRPDVAILDIRMPVMDGIEVARVLHDEHLAPVLILTGYPEADLVRRASDAGVYYYLVKPYRDTDLMPAVEITLSRWKEYLALEKEARSLEEKLETRKVVERAKGILMDKLGLSESEAFRRIQLQAMNTRKSMREIAEAIIVAYSV